MSCIIFLKKFLFFLFAINFSLLCLDSKAQTISSEEFISGLIDEGSLGIFDEPAIDVFNDICNVVPTSLTSSIKEPIQFFCKAITSSKICEKVKKEDLLNCNNFHESKEFDTVDFFAGCGIGLFESAEELLAFVWETLKWIWEKASHPVATYEEASEYIESVKLYLADEYDKAYEKETPPWRGVKAASEVTQSLANMLFKGIQDFLYAEYQEFACLNFKAKTETICKVAGYFATPIVALAVIKHGARSIQHSKLLASKKNDILKSASSSQISQFNKRQQLAKSVLKRNLTDKQKIAVIKAHEVGLKEKGLDGGPAGIGNYTMAQLKRKSEVLKEAGFSSQEIRSLMEKGVVGISIGGFTKLFKRELLLTEKPYYNKFREQFNAGKINEEHKYVVFKLEEEEFYGEIISIGRNKVIIKDSRNDRYTLSGKELESVIANANFKLRFTLEQNNIPTPATGTAGTAGIKNYNRNKLKRENEFKEAGYSKQEIKKLMEKESTSISTTGFSNIFRKKLSMTSKPSMDKFRSQFNAGRIEGDTRYINFRIGGKELYGEVTSIGRNKVTVKDVLGKEYVLSDRQLLSIGVSDTSKDLFNLSIGDSVAFPRRVGRFTNGTITKVHQDGKLSIDFKDQGMKTKNIEVYSKQVHPPFELRQKVRVSRTGGGYTNGTITEVLEDGRLSVVFPDGANMKIKTIASNRTRSPYKVQQEVKVPRTGGGYTNGRITKVHEDGRLSVVFLDGVNMKIKTIASKQMRSPFRIGSRVTFMKSDDIGVQAYVTEVYENGTVSIAFPVEGLITRKVVDSRELRSPINWWDKR